MAADAFCARRGLGRNAKSENTNPDAKEIRIDAKKVPETKGDKENEFPFMSDKLLVSAGDSQRGQ